MALSKTSGSSRNLENLESLKCEVLIIGAGLIGSALAVSLAQGGVKDVLVVDFDQEGTLSSSELNAGGVRATWNQPINIQMAAETIRYLSKNAEEVGFKECGYLWLMGQSKYEQALNSQAAQVAQGWKVENWTRAQLIQHFPFIDKFDGIDGIIYSPQDGLVNPNLLKNHFRRAAKGLGVRFLDRVWIHTGEVTTDRCSVVGFHYPEILQEDFKKNKLTHFDKPYLENVLCTIKIHADQVVNCAGAWASQVAEVLGYFSPCFASRRQISLFDSRDVDLSPYGMMIDPSGVYFHPEAQNVLAGFADPRERPGVNYQSDGEGFFVNHIWPALFERSSSFEKMRFITGWSGQYEVSPDESAVIGQVLQGRVGQSGRVYEAHSFSGHGVMHCYSAAQELSERLLRRKGRILDLDQLNGQRFELGQLVKESQVI